MRKLFVLMLVFSTLLVVFFASSSPVMAQDFCASECAAMGYDTGECDYTTNYCSDFPKCESNLCRYNCFDSGEFSCYPGYCYCYDYEYCDCETKVCTSTGCAEPSCSEWLGFADPLRAGSILKVIPTTSRPARRGSPRIGSSPVPARALWCGTCSRWSICRPRSSSHRGSPLRCRSQPI